MYRIILLFVMFFVFSTAVMGDEPPWKGFTEGTPGAVVPAPWTPLVLEGMTVKMWGRSYVFGMDSPLPKQIITQGESILAAPMKVNLSPAPKMWRLLLKKRKDDTTVEFQWEADAKSVKYRAVTQVYFDGIIRFELTIPAETKVAYYSLETDMQRKYASYVHRGPWGFGGLTTGYALPSAPQTFSIRNVFYLMNENLGFCWFDGMKFDWKLAAPNKALELIPSDKNVTLKIHYIDSPGEYKTDRIFSSGFQVLPVRPMPEKCDEMRMSYSVIYSDEDPKRSPAWTAPVEYDASGNINIANGTVELQVKPSFEEKDARRGEEFFHTSHGRYYRLSFGNDSQDGIYVQIYEQFKRKAYVASGVKLPAGRWTHVAFTWGNVINIYVDGVLRGSVPFKGSSSIYPMILCAGGQRMAVDSLRISNVARDHFDVANPPTADENTLLLDNFDKSNYLNGRRATLPEKISSDAECGYLTPNGKLGPGHSGSGTAPLDAPSPSMIEAYSRLGAKALLFHAAQPTGNSISDLHISNQKAFQKTVSAIHSNKMKALLYINNSLANTDKLWNAYADKWLITPRGYPFTPGNRPKEQNYQACPRSEYIDYFFWKIARNMDEFGIDGVFLDGRMYTSCSNELHGCGIVDFEGRKVSKRDVWDGRLKAWRLYNIVKARNGYCEQHKSSLWDAPTCFFWDGIWEGEQFMNLKRGTRKRLDILPLQGFRMLLNGIPFGMPTRFCSYAYQPFSPVECCTFAFVHGTTWTQTYRINEMQVIAPYWKTLEEFGATYHNFRPYWSENLPTLSTPDPLLKVSAYVRTDRALIIAANFNEDKMEVSGTVTLNLHSLGLKNIRVSNAFSGEEIPVLNQNQIHIKIKSFRQAWFVAEEKQKESK